VSYSVKEKFKKQTSKRKMKFYLYLRKIVIFKARKIMLLVHTVLTAAVNKVVMFSVLMQHSVDFPLFVDLADNHTGRDEQ
jgi:hypothetical protein